MPYDVELELSDVLDEILNSAVIESITGRNLEVENNIVTKILNTQVKIGELNLKEKKRLPAQPCSLLQAFGESQTG